MKVERVSYPIMTPSAARKVLEAIFWEPQMCYLIDQILVVKKGRWFSFRRNEVSAVISMDSAKSWMIGKSPVKFIEAGGGAADAAQRNMLALADVEYLITAEIRLTKRAEKPKDNLGKYIEELRRRAGNQNPRLEPRGGLRMILQRHYELADRENLLDDPAFVTMDIACRIDIDAEGNFLGLHDLRQRTE